MSAAEYEPPFHITGIEAYPYPEGHEPDFKDFYIETDVALRDDRGEFQPDALVLENVLALRGCALPTIRRPGESANRLFCVVKDQKIATKEVPEPDALNELIVGSPLPDVRTARSAEYPGLITVHRSIAFGQIAMQFLRGLPPVATAEIVDTGPHSPLPHNLYDRNSLAMVRLHFGVGVDESELAIQELLTR